ncbi:hypothetical protein ALC57_05103, partial [Trachymyrmex cornetzi]
KQVATELHSKLAYSIPNTLKNHIKRSKDQFNFFSNQEVVYKISCDDCDASYVGQTKRQLQTRLQEYRSDIKNKTRSPSVITNYRVNCNHEFNWNKVSILDKEHSYNKRLISEMVYIKKQKQNLNRQNDTKSLHEILSSYYSISFSFVDLCFSSSLITLSILFPILSIVPLMAPAHRTRQRLPCGESWHDNQSTSRLLGSNRL